MFYPFGSLLKTLVDAYYTMTLNRIESSKKNINEDLTSRLKNTTKVNKRFRRDTNKSSHTTT